MQSWVDACAYFRSKIVNINKDGAAAPLKRLFPLLDNMQYSNNKEQQNMFLSKGDDTVNTLLWLEIRFFAGLDKFKQVLTRSRIQLVQAAKKLRVQFHFYSRRNRNSNRFQVSTENQFQRP